MPLSTKVLEEKRAFRVGDSENVGCEKVRRWVVRRSGLWTEVSIKWLDGMEEEDGETEDLASSSGRISTRFSSSSSNNCSRMHSNTRSSSSSSMEGRRVVMANSNGNQSGTRPMSLVVVKEISAGKKCPLIKLL